MWKWVLVDMVIVYQPTPGLVEQPGIHGNARDVRTNGCVPGHSPLREKLRDFLQSHILRVPMLVLQMSQAFPHGALPDSAPFHRAPPHCPNSRWKFIMLTSKADAISSRQMEHSPGPVCRNAHSSRRRAKRRSCSTSFDRLCIVLKTAFSHRRRRAVASPGEICCDRQVGDVARFSIMTSWKPSMAIFESGNINRS